MARVFRIFISSTFQDWAPEREYLRKQVFPRLRRLCEENKARFLPVDLRWGISEEAAETHETVAICLEEIQRCQQLSPRPNFIVLLGNRYGWRPVPRKLSEDQWGKLMELGVIQKGDLFHAWYERDDNAVPAIYRLRPVSDENLEGRGAWSEAEQLLRSSLDENYQKTEAHWRQKFGEDELAFLVGSVTEQEIVRGALAASDAPDHVHVFLRDLVGKIDSSLYADADGPDGKIVQDRLESLKKRLEKPFEQNLHRYSYEYDPSWAEDHRPESYLGCFGEDVYRALASIIEKELEQPTTVNEVAPPETRHFVGFKAELDAILKAKDGSLLVYGEPGIGKSTLLSKASEELARRGKVLAYWIGRDPRCATGGGLLRSMLEDLRRKSLVAAEVSREPIVGKSFGELSQLLRSALSKLTPEAKGSLWILVDALDQLPEDDPARTLGWAPEDASFLFSTLDEDIREAFCERFGAGSVIELGQMERESASCLLKAWLENAGRRLQEPQQHAVLDAFDKSGRPLHLRLLFEEARSWLSSRSVSSGDLPGSTDEAIRRLFDELVRGHGQDMTRRVVGYLTAGPNGLSEDELLRLIRQDEQVVAEFRHRSPKSPPVDELPEIVWSRFYHDLEPFLTRRQVDGEMLLDFHHLQFRRVAEASWLDGEVLADCRRRFAAMLLREWGLHDGQVRERVIRRAAHALGKAGHGQPLFDLMRDDAFIELQKRLDAHLPGDSLLVALEEAVRLGDLRHLAALAIRRGKVMDSLRGESPLEALKRGELERALDLAHKHDERRRSQILLMLAWHLVHTEHVGACASALKEIVRRLKETDMSGIVKSVFPFGLIWGTLLKKILPHKDLIDPAMLKDDAFMRPLKDSSEARIQAIEALVQPPVDAGSVSEAADLVKRTKGEGKREYSRLVKIAGEMAQMDARLAWSLFEQISQTHNGPDLDHLGDDEARDLVQGGARLLANVEPSNPEQVEQLTDLVLEVCRKQKGRGCGDFFGIDAERIIESCKDMDEAFAQVQELIARAHGVCNSDLLGYTDVISAIAGRVAKRFPDMALSLMRDAVKKIKNVPYDVSSGVVSIARNMGKVIGILPDPDTLSLFDDLVEIARDLPDSWVEKHPLALASIAEQMAGLCQTEWADFFEDTIEEAMDAIESVEGSLKLARAISNLSRPLEGIAGENPEKTYDILRRMLECAKNITGDGEVSEAFAAIGHAMRGLAKHEKPISQDMLKEWVGLLSGIDHVWDWEHTIPVMHIRSGLVDLLRIAPNQGAELLLPALWSKDEDVRRAREAKSICDIALNAKKLEPNRDDGCELFKSAMAATERIKGHLSAVRVCADSFVSAASICQECGRMAVKHALERARAEKADWARADSFQRISKVLVKSASLPGNSEVLKEVITDELACFKEDRKRQHGLSEGEVSWMDWDHSERLQALAEPISTLAESDPDWAFEKAMQALNIVSNMDDPSRAAGALAAYAPVAASIAKKRQGLGQKLFDKLLELIRLKEGDSKKGLILSEAGTAVAVGLWTFDLVRAERLIEDVVNSVREIEDNWSVGKAVCNISSSLRTWAELDQEHAQEVLCRMMEKAKDAGDHRMLDKLNGMELMSGYREPPEQETWPAEIEEAIQNINSCPHEDQRPEWIARLAEWVQEVVEEGDRLFKVMRRLDTKVRHLLLMSTPCLDVGTWSLALSLQLLATVMSERNCNAILDGMRMEGLLE